MAKSLYFSAGMIVGALAIRAASEPTLQDPVKVSPQYYSVRLENDRVRVLEYRLKPGEKELPHAHSPGVLYSLADAKVRSTLPDGTASERSSVAGEVSWRDWTRHSLENVGLTEVHALSIELKECKP